MFARGPGFLACARSARHAVLVSQTTQTVLTIGATLAGAIIGFIGTSYLQMLTPQPCSLTGPALTRRPKG